MKRLLFLIIIACHVMAAAAQGIPFIRNYKSTDYHAHNMNFDIEVGTDGTVYVANFEGLLYYDRAEWHIIHTPGITRVTVVKCTDDGTVWVGGYNFFGRIEKKSNGERYLHRVGKSGLFHGEIQEIWESDGALSVLVNDGSTYRVEGDSVTLKKSLGNQQKNIGLTDIVETDAIDHDNKIVVLSDITQTEPLSDGMKAVVKKGQGLVITDAAGRELYTITEANGLCDNNVVWVSYDGHGQLWGATDNGIFSIAIPSVFTHFTATEGIVGEVLSIESFAGTIFVGTNNGLYRLNGKAFTNVSGIHHATWKLSKSQRGLLAATVNGVYHITANGSVRQLTTGGTTAILDTGTHIYSGEMDGVYLTNITTGSRTLVCKLEKVTKIMQDRQGTIWLQSLYGEVWNKKPTDADFKPYRSSTEEEEEAATIVMVDDKIEVLSENATKPFPYPDFSYTDNSGVTWLTNNEGKTLYRWKNGKRLTDIDRLLTPFSNISVRAVLSQGTNVWIGGNNELIVIDTSREDPALQTTPRLYIRSFVVSNDSVLWGGYGTMPQELPRLGSNERNIHVAYSLEYAPPVGTTYYRYKLNNGKWSAWSSDRDVDFINLPYGSYTLTVQALLPTGIQTETASINFSIAYPVYLRWYSLLLYLLIATLLVILLVRYRLHRLEMEKQRLENIVQERTAEVVKQKDEIEEKSKSLEKALDDLSNAQNELIRQEKMATAGKLTQGLIDRILNPLNYINNFTKLSEGLVKDIKANIEDEKDNMDPDNYDDTVDVLEMLAGNLEKVYEHGQNNTRILKAMEEMLKDRSSGIVPMDFAPVLKQDMEMLCNYFAEDINTHAIKTTLNIPQGTISINGNAEQLSMAMLSMLGNAVYAIKKKALRTKYQPELTVNATVDTNNVNVSIRDNGIGIEDTIINKIFDPFFTTKPTGEAAGVGLYLSREILQNHRGDISVKSEKDVYTEFVITIPLLKN
jgi:signal transduction histidine kinase